jgi:hypothetical protein
MEESMARPNAMIALKMPEGMVFGKVRKVSVSRILFEIEIELMLGQQFEWRMELTGWNSTVLGRLQIRRFQEREDRPNLAEARIVHISGEDSRQFQDWLTELSVGGTTRRYETDPSSIAGTRRGQMSGASRAQSRHALNRLDRRLGDKASLDPTQSDAFGLSSQLSSAISGIEEGRTGRQAMSNALKASLKGGGRRRRVAPQTLTPQLSDDPIVAAPTHRANATASAPATQSSSKPEIRMSTRQGVECIQVRYPDAASYRQAWTEHIQRSGLFIDQQIPGQRGSQRKLELILPSGRSLQCTAQIVAPMPSGTGLALQLQPAQIKILRDEASRLP